MSLTNHCRFIAREAYARANIILRCFFLNTDRYFLLNLYLVVSIQFY